VRVFNEDTRRVRDIYDLTVQIENKGHGGGLHTPPASLTDLAVAGKDPFSGEPYEYRRLDADRYQVCARFNVASPAPFGASALFWAHPAGRKRFEVSFARGAPPPPDYFR
jgi:hypothetical protein